jgi:hypothetical protein
MQSAMLADVVNDKMPTVIRRSIPEFSVKESCSQFSSIGGLTHGNETAEFCRQLVSLHTIFSRIVSRTDRSTLK